METFKPNYEILPPLESLLASGNVQPADVDQARQEWRERFKDDKYEQILEAKEDE